MNKKQKAIQKKEQDLALNRALAWVGVATVIELALILVNDLYFRFTNDASSVSNALITEAALRVLRVGAPVISLALLLMILLRKRDGRAVQLPLVLGAVTLGALFFFSHVILTFQDTGVRMLFVLVPACGGLAMVYYLYQREFFLSGLLTGFGVVGLWMLRHMGPRANATIYAYLAVTALIFVGVCLLMQKKQPGAVSLTGGEVLRQEENGALVLITALVNASCLVLAFLMGAEIAYYLIYMLVAWLFALLVYHTVKMM